MNISLTVWTLYWIHKVSPIWLIWGKGDTLKKIFYAKLKEFIISQPSLYLKHWSFKYWIKFPLWSRETHLFSIWKFCNPYSSCSNRIQLSLLECCSDWPASHNHLTVDNFHTEEGLPNIPSIFSIWVDHSRDNICLPFTKHLTSLL